MTHEDEVEFATLLEESALSSWERRKRRMERIPSEIEAEAPIKGAVRKAPDRAGVHCFTSWLSSS